MLNQRSVLNIVVTVLCASAALAQSPPPRQPGRAGPEPLFFTDKIVDLAVDRILDDMAKHYNFSGDQLEFVRDEVKARFPQFISENRDQVVTLANQYMEALLGGDPPSKEYVAQWATSVKPLINKFADMVEDTREAIRPILNDEQQVQMDGEMAAFRVGVNYSNDRLSVWESGGYDWQSEWPRSDEFKQKEAIRVKEVQDAQSVAKSQATGEPLPTDNAGSGAAPNAKEVTPAKPVSTPAEKPKQKDEWEVYVDNFIKRYKLDDAQQNSARRTLNSLQETRDRYARRKLSSIESLEKKFAAAKSESDKAELKKQLDAINKPIDAMFAQLKDKLDQLPNRKQRAEAAKSEPEKSPAAPAADKGEKKP